MALVGDVIIGFREQATDLPQSVPGPYALVSLTGTTVSGGFFGGTVFVNVTVINPWGESGPSGEQSITLGGGQNAVQVKVTFPPSATAIRAYYGAVAGGELTYEQFPITGGSPQTVTILNQGVTGSVPARSTAYLPDTDGPAVGAYSAYRWFNQALAWAASKNRGGLPDFGAAGTVSGQGNYVMPGYWKKIDSAWYDGFPLGLLNKNNVFRRNPVTGYAGMLTIFQASDRLMVEAWPQPNRTSAQTTLASPMALTDTVATLTSAASYVLGFGLTKIGSEIVNYAAISGNQLTGLTRGMCGTVPAAQLAGASVTELNLMIAGYRVPATYAVGQSTSTLYLPPGWESALISYMLYRFRKAEQDDAGASAYLKEAEAQMSDLSATRIIAGPRQVQPWGGIGPEVVAGYGSRFGGVLLP